MKKRVLFTGIFLLLAVIPGCSSSSESMTTAPPQTTLVVEDWLPDGIISAGEYSNSRKFGDYTLYWRSDEENIYFGMAAKTDGWVAIGIQPGSRMKDADMIFGFVKDGEVEIQDQYSTGDFGPHSLDTELGGSDDIVAFGGIEDDEFTTIEFSRKMNTGDTYDNPVSPGVNKIIWSYSSSDSLSARHSTRGYGEIEL